MYRYNFELMQDSLPQISQDMGNINAINIEENVAEFEMQSIQDGTAYSFYIMFVKDLDGIWKLRFY